MVMFSVQTDSPDHHKDSLRNVEETGEFVVNIVGEAQFDAMNISSGNFAYGDNEFIHAGLEMVDSDSISVPRVGNVPAALECVHYDTLRLPRNAQGGGYIVVIGTVTRIYIDDAVIQVIEGPLKFLPVVLGFFIASSYFFSSSFSGGFSRQAAVKSADSSFRRLRILLVLVGLL